MHLRYFRLHNHSGAVNVSLVGPFLPGKDAVVPEDLAEQRERNSDAEVERLLETGVERFLAVAG